MEKSQGTIRQRRGGDSVEVKTQAESVKPTAKSTGWIVFVEVFFTLVSIIACFWVYVEFVAESPIKSTSITLPTPPKWVGPLAPNELLTKVEKHLKGQVFGPESLLYHKGDLYTGCADGKIYRTVPKEKVKEFIGTFGQEPCSGPETEHTCGRPLGLRMDKDGYLIIADAYLGLFKLNVVTGDFKRYISPSDAPDGHPIKFLNDVAIDSQGVIYISESSTTWQRRDFMYSLLEGDNTGRVLRYDPHNNSLTVLVKGLYFANGVQLSRDESYLLIAESTMARIQKYNLKGPKQGVLEEFSSNLPGLPDNIRLSSSGGYWVGMATCRQTSLFSYDSVMAWPSFKTLVAKLFSALTIARFLNPCGLIVQVGNDGEILSSLQDLSGTVIQSVSEVEDDGGMLYFGSFKAPFIAQLDTRRMPNKKP